MKNRTLTIIMITLSSVLAIAGFFLVFRYSCWQLAVGLFLLFWSSGIDNIRRQRKS